MIGLVIGVQILLPVALILWLAVVPAVSRLGVVLQAAGVGAFLYALALVAQWAVVPWWLPRLYGALWAAATVRLVLRNHTTGVGVVPGGLGQWVQLVVAVILLALGAGYGYAAIQGRTPPPAPTIDVASPLGAGHYLVASGGGREIVNAHLRTLDPAVERYRSWRGQSYAIDFFGLTPWGTRATGWRPADPTAYAIFGADILAPCGGTVVAMENAMPDLPVPEQDLIHRLGNHVLLACDEAIIVLAHLRRNSVAVLPGQRVAVGERLGAVGNSGATTEPHLHIHAQSPAAAGQPPISGEPLALRINGRFLVRNDRIDARP